MLHDIPGGITNIVWNGHDPLWRLQAVSVATFYIVILYISLLNLESEYNMWLAAVGLCQH